MSTVTLRQLRHDFASVESAAKKLARWTPPDFTARARAQFGERFTVLSLLDELAQDDGR